MKNILLIILLLVSFSVRAMEDEKDWVFVDDNFKIKNVVFEYNHVLGLITANLRQGDYHVKMVKYLATGDINTTVDAEIKSEWCFGGQDDNVSLMKSVLLDAIDEFECILQSQIKNKTSEFERDLKPTRE